MEQKGIEINKEKQIEEMVKDLCQNGGVCSLQEWNDCHLDVGKYCTKCNTVAERLYEAGYRKQEWISVDERLPEPNAHVLIYVFFHNQWQIVKGWFSFCDKKFHIVNSDYPSLTGISTTHWMPLPEAPKMKGGK